MIDLYGPHHDIYDSADDEDRDRESTKRNSMELELYDQKHPMYLFAFSLSTILSYRKRNTCITQPVPYPIPHNHIEL
jgi:hypothetical protein